jgi:hypothetical protein
VRRSQTITLGWCSGEKDGLNKYTGTVGMNLLCLSFLSYTVGKEYRRFNQALHKDYGTFAANLRQLKRRTKNAQSRIVSGNK